MRRLLAGLDRLLGRAYSRLLAAFCGVVALFFFASGALILWRSGGHLFGWLWLGGGVLFAAIGIASWRSRAPLSDALRT